MGVRILHDTNEDVAVMYCSTTMWAFGPLFYENEDIDLDVDEIAQGYVEYVRETTGKDPRSLSDNELIDIKQDYLTTLRKPSYETVRMAPIGYCESCGETWEDCDRMRRKQR